MYSISTRALRIIVGSRPVEVLENVPVEEVFELIVNGEHFRTLYATPTMIRELAVGNIFSMGVVGCSSEIRSVELEGNRIFVKTMESSSNVARKWKHTVDHSINPATCLLYTSPSPRDLSTSRMPSSA